MFSTYRFHDRDAQALREVEDAHLRREVSVLVRLGILSRFCRVDVAFNCGSVMR
jgi:hypothetical protein